MVLKAPGALVGIALAVGVCIAVKAEAGESAGVSESEARAAALARVPGGNVKSHELEKENGRLLWTYDIARPSVKGVTEVHVDAKSGKVIAVKRETPAQEADEARSEKGKAR